MGRVIGGGGWVGANARERNRLDNLTQSLGYTCTTFPVNTWGAVQTVVTGTTYAGSVYIYNGEKISSIEMYAYNAASGLTLAKAGVFNSSGTLLTSCSSAHATVNGAVNRIPIALSSTWTCEADGLYFLGFLMVGTTGSNLNANHISGVQTQQAGGTGVLHTWAVTGQTDLVSVTPAKGTGLHFFMGATP